MGINRETLNFLEETIRENKIGSLRMVELGNQFMKGMHIETGRIAKDYFISKGFDHTSIDKNGKDGALPISLNKEIFNTTLIKSFDILTNFGTTEHVTNQYICWKNIHNLVKQNGLFVHLVPLTKNWKGHGYYKYTTDFFYKLSKECNYEILKHFIRKDLPGKDMICCSMIKLQDNVFVPEENFFKPIEEG